MDNYNRQQQMYRRNQMAGNNCGIGNNNGNYNNMQQNTACNVYNDESACAIPNPVLGMAYIVNQKWCSVYEPCKALKAGTIFPMLDLPFLGRSCGRR